MQDVIINILEIELYVCVKINLNLDDN